MTESYLVLAQPSSSYVILCYAKEFRFDLVTVKAKLSATRRDNNRLH
jgi:hypothetical protein